MGILEIKIRTLSGALFSRGISCFLCQAEELGCEGKVEEAQGIMKLCDQLNEERTQLQNVSTACQTALVSLSIC